MADEAAKRPARAVEARRPAPRTLLLSDLVRSTVRQADAAR